MQGRGGGGEPASAKPRTDKVGELPGVGEEKSYKAGTGRQGGSGRNCPHPRFRGDGGNYSLAHFLDIHHTPFADLEVHLLVVEVILPTLANRGAMAVLQLHDPVRLAAGLADDGAGAVAGDHHAITEAERKIGHRDRKSPRLNTSH